MARLLILCSSILLLITLSNGETLVSLGRLNVNEWFSIKIEPKLFNLTFEQPNQFEYRFSLKNYPDLPSWLRYMYSTEYDSGFLYGTPPEKLGGHEVSAFCVTKFNDIFFCYENMLIAIYFIN